MSSRRRSATTSTMVGEDDGTVIIGIVCSTPTDAATSLVEAWRAGSRAAAARCATDAVVTQLFARTDAARWTFQGCGGPDPGVPVCTFAHPGGSAQLTVEGTEARGWTVTRLRL